MIHAFPNIPLDKAQPDARRFIDTIMGRVQPERPPLVEYLVDDALRKPITTELLGRQWVEPVPGDRASMEAYLDNFIAFWHGLGYDFVRYEESLPFAISALASEDSTALNGRRTWRNLHKGSISGWGDFEAYLWPQVTAESMRNYEYLAAHLPEGMGLMVCHAGGIYEHLSALFSYEGLCLALYDDPDLVRAVAQRLGETMYAFYRQLVELDNVIAIFPGDDMGFRSATLLPPDALRTYTLPWHKRYACLAHEHGLPYFLHSCGNLKEIMGDLIDQVGVDAKHSYENAIMPVDEFQATYGNRIGVLGGVDVDVLGRRSPDEVRAEVRRIIDTCHPRGRFAIGSGNSVPSYIPLVNYLTMVDEALR
jgi:uroporphyrinogen decarboxylase